MERLLKVGSVFTGNFPRRLILSLNELAAMGDSSKSSKSYKVRDFLPSVRPSYLSLTLLFACGILWLKNEATNNRLLALENRLEMQPLKGAVENTTPKRNHEGTTSKPTGAWIGAFETKKLDNLSCKNHDCCIF